MNDTPSENPEDLRVVAPLVGPYADWLCDIPGGKSLDQILEENPNLTQPQQKLLRECCDDVTVARGRYNELTGRQGRG